MLAPMLALALTALEVHLAPDSGAARCTKNGWVTARSSDGQALVRIPLRQDQHAYSMQLSGESIWEIAIDANGCWSETAHGPAGGGALTLALHRAATVSGAFESDVKARPDGELRGFVFPQQRGGAGESLGVSGLATQCELDFPQWQCSVPADVPLDLRLELPGFGAIHYFGVAAAEGPAKKLPAQPLLAGATLSGWVQDSERLAVPNAKLTLYPMQVHAYSGETQGLAARRQAATANAKGFFQFAGLQPGLYPTRFRSGGLFSRERARSAGARRRVSRLAASHPSAARCAIGGTAFAAARSGREPVGRRASGKGTAACRACAATAEEASADGQWKPRVCALTHIG